MHIEQGTFGTINYKLKLTTAREENCRGRSKRRPPIGPNRIHSTSHRQKSSRHWRDSNSQCKTNARANSKIIMETKDSSRLVNLQAERRRRRSPCHRGRPLHTHGGHDMSQLSCTPACCKAARSSREPTCRRCGRRASYHTGPKCTYQNAANHNCAQPCMITFPIATKGSCTCASRMSATIVLETVPRQPRQHSRNSYGFSALPVVHAIGPETCGSRQSSTHRHGLE
jgi:hypothetical protein